MRDTRSVGGRRGQRTRAAAALVAVVALTSSARGDLPFLDLFADSYRTPRSGEGFRTEVFGQRIDVPKRDRRSLVAWDIGAAGGIPGADESEVLPFASLYVWEHRDDWLFRGVLVGLYDEIFLAYSPESWGGLEAVLTFDNLNVPFEQGEQIDGIIDDAQKTTWGWLRPGIGGGYRTAISPHEQDSMLALTWTFEPSFVYFSKGDSAVGAYVAPQDTFDLRSHFQMRLDALERNLLELPHAGWAAGLDGVYGYRTNWEDWGVGRREDASQTRDYAFLTGYAMGVAGLPWTDSERHRLLVSVHGGIGADLDRYSAPRVGGGPHPFGEEYGSTFRPVLPGAAIDEFTPDHYAVMVGEYRWEPVFFSYFSVRGSLGWLDRDRRRGGRIRREDDLFASVGARITSGFLFETRIQIDYNYSFSVVRRDGYGAHEVVIHISGEF